MLDKKLTVMPDRSTLKPRIKAGLEPEKEDVLWLDDGIGAN